MINNKSRNYWELNLHQTQQQSKDQETIYKSFYEVFDRSQIEQLVTRNQSISAPKGLSLIGKGSHFTVYKFNPRPTNGLMHLAIAIAHKGQDAYRTQAYRPESWYKNMKKLNSIAINLIPPFELFKSSQSYAWASPLGDSPCTIAKHWLPIEEHLKLLTKNLEVKKLAINDHLQIKAWRGIPFVCDLSDLEQL